MRYTNLHFTYLLTYSLTYLLTYRTDRTDRTGQTTVR